ncbi:serine/threonine-protein kinase pelle isoform X2 [Condylostylus longicornis]|uniref:serine/threonine-protein kinase pelle isoform X2 n=1 Tax=Condylostylus longicornis TaxID=2530218 RepID=UPI00244DF1FA|nr:serine/threonine-protein kinase pelle isoform X2 [Condylostylus longicornis]
MANTSCSIYGLWKCGLTSKRLAQAGNSPSDELLNMWGEHNHTITELYILLYRMKHHAAMNSIRNLVEKKYQDLIPSSYFEQLTSEQPDWKQILPNSDDKKQWQNQVSNSNNESEITSTTGNSASIYGAENFIKQRDVSRYAGAIPQINYFELSDATGGWDDRCILGKGGFGTVYKGNWKLTPVAIKRIQYNDRHSNQTAINKIQIEQSLNEMKHLNSYRHDNILTLYGYCITNNEQCLVYQLMAGGSLEQRLNPFSKYPPLSWKQRLNIAQGTARGLQFLHTLHEKPLIHGDIKPANILLDPCCIPKIGDFGLAREGPNALNSSIEVSKVYGTKPYLPLEFLTARSLSTKIDVYSFGVVLLELSSGLRAYDKKRVHKFLTKHILTKLLENEPIQAFMDNNLPFDSNGINVSKAFIGLGQNCIAEKPENRPEMVTVLEHLLGVCVTEH